MSQHEFGGDWTTEKLDRVRKYLQAYTIIFDRNIRARNLIPVYVDAFAGSGYRTRPEKIAEIGDLLPDFADPETQIFLKGSPRIALDVQPPFKKYIFIELDQERAQELESLKVEYPHHAKKISVVSAEANTFLMDWCQKTDWKRHRAVVFLDPYGMQVEWDLIKVIAETKAIDLWILFPLGVAANRLLKKTGPPAEPWAQALTRIFGTDEWRSAFYPQRKVFTLFGEEDDQSKLADFRKIGEFFVKRLMTVFSAVAQNPLPLMNSRNNPLYLLCFASGNPKGAATAVKIAQHILRS